jgi:hypothetical protein
MIKIKPSNKNTNKHTKEGMDLLENSINKVGVIESISVATDGTIISGHARKEIFDKQGKKPKFIKLEDNEYPVIETDIENNSKQYFEAQILANTTANKNFDLDNELIEEIAFEFDIDIEEVGIEKVIEKIENSEEGDLIEIPKSLQIIPKKEYLIIMADEDSEEWEELKQIFSCGLVRQGGCKIGSSSDKAGTGIERVFDLKTFKERVSNGLRISNT